MEEKSRIEFKAALYAQDFALAELLARAELQMRPDDFAWCNSLGLSKLLQGSDNEALEYFLKAGEQKNSEALLNASILLAQCGRYEEALLKFQEAKQNG